MRVPAALRPPPLGRPHRWARRPARDLPGEGTRVNGERRRGGVVPSPCSLAMKAAEEGLDHSVVSGTH